MRCCGSLVYALQPTVKIRPKLRRGRHALHAPHDDGRVMQGRPDCAARGEVPLAALQPHAGLRSHCAGATILTLAGASLSALLPVWVRFPSNRVAVGLLSASSLCELLAFEHSWARACATPLLKLLSDRQPLPSAAGAWLPHRSAHSLNSAIHARRQGGAMPALPLPPLCATAAGACSTCAARHRIRSR